MLCPPPPPPPTGRLWREYSIGGAPPPFNLRTLNIESILSKELLALDIMHMCPYQYILLNNGILKLNSSYGVYGLISDE